VGPHAARLAATLPPRTLRAGQEEPAAAAIVTFLGAAADPAARQTLLAGLRARLAADTPIVLIDHNQPRTWRRRVRGAVALAMRGLGPARARYPAARELAALGLEVVRLRLARGERVQLVLARRGGAAELVVPPASK